MSRFGQLAERVPLPRNESGHFVPTNPICRIPKELTRSIFGMLGCRWWKVIPMLKPKTHFEQIPLKLVLKMVVRQIRREHKASQDELNRMEKLARDHLAARENPTERI